MQDLNKKIKVRTPNKKYPTPADEKADNYFYTNKKTGRDTRFQIFHNYEIVKVSTRDRLCQETYNLIGIYYNTLVDEIYKQTDLLIKNYSITLVIKE